MSSKFKAASPRHKCHPTKSIGSFERNTRRAASGSGPEVILRCGSHIPFAARVSAHHDATPHFSCNFRVLRQSERHIRKRPQRDQGESRIFIDALNHRVHCGQRLGNSLWRGVPVIAQAVLAMKPLRMQMLAVEWLLGPQKHGHIRSTKLGSIESVSRGLSNRYIPRDRCDGSHANVRRTQSHNERHGIVRTSVSINQKGPRHGTQATILPGGNVTQ